MHKLMHKGLKKKKKTKKNKKGAEEDEFDPEELERYRRERAEALEKASIEGGEYSGEAAGAAAAASSSSTSTSADGSSGGTATAGSDEWKKFQALTAGVDSILKKTQGDLDRIKSTSFFQRKAPIVEEKKPIEDPEVTKNKAKRFIGYDKDGNPIEQEVQTKETVVEGGKLTVTEDGFVHVPEDDDDADDSGEEDIFDTTYVDVLQNIDIQLAYIPDSPTNEEAGDDPFDTTNADKVLKTVDKHGKKVVSLGNAVEVLAGRIDYVSTCKISRPRKVTTQDLLLGDVETVDSTDTAVAEPLEVEKTLLDDDSDLPDIPINLTEIPPILVKPVVTTDTSDNSEKSQNVIDISEFEILKEKTILEEIPDFDDEFDLHGTGDAETVGCLNETDDPFAEKEPDTANLQDEIIEASFETATFVDEEDPFDTTFADNLVPGKTELKFIEKELEELPESEVSISLTDPAGLHRDYETGLLKNAAATSDLLGGSTTDLTQLTDQPIVPAEEITYVDPFDTSGIREIAPGQTELKFLEKELLGEDNLEDDDFDPRKEETTVTVQPIHQVSIESTHNKPNFDVTFEVTEVVESIGPSKERKPSRPEVLGLGPVKSVAFELPTPSQRPDLLITNDEEKSIPSKPLTPYYSQKSLEEALPEADVDNVNVDPFDTSFVSKVQPGKTELKLIESELLKQETTGLTHSISEHDLNPKLNSTTARRQSDFGTTCVRPKSLKLGDFVDESLIEDVEETKKSVFQINEDVHRQKHEPTRQESLLDAHCAVDVKALTPRIESKTIPQEDEEISYVDPFDTSIACNILPGKAELKLLESELSQITPQVQSIPVNIDFDKVSQQPVTSTLYDEDDFDPRAEVKQDFLFSDGPNPGDKVLTPLHTRHQDFEESVDPFDTSFATLGPGKTELKLLESELMDK